MWSDIAGENSQRWARPASARKPRILLIEDLEHPLKIGAAMLESCGFEVVKGLYWPDTDRQCSIPGALTFHDVASITRFALNPHYGIGGVLTDIDRNSDPYGVKLAEDLRQKNFHAPIFAYSAVDFHEFHDRFHACNAPVFLKTPMGVTQAAADRIKEAMAQHQATQR